MDQPQQSSPDEIADPNWFRRPTRREHLIASALFTGFGVSFVLLFIVLAGWWFRWVIVSLAVYSIWRGFRHLLGAIEASESS